jgi:hypothetical protein
MCFLFKNIYLLIVSTVSFTAIKLSRHTGRDAGIHRPGTAQVGCVNAYEAS